MLTYVVGFFATAGAAGVDFGLNSRDKKDVKHGRLGRHRAGHHPHRGPFAAGRRGRLRLDRSIDAKAAAAAGTAEERSILQTQLQPDPGRVLGRGCGASG